MRYEDFLEMATPRYWLFDWIDAHGIKKSRQLEILLRDAGARADLVRRATNPYSDGAETLGTQDATIIAGRPLDLSGQLDCMHWLCIKKQLDNLFTHVLHYFDHIVVAAADARLVEACDRSQPNPLAIESLLGHIRILLYIREIGAEELFVFRPKPHFCELHMAESLKESGMTDTIAQKIQDLTRDARVTVNIHDNYIDYTFTHPAFDHDIHGLITGKRDVSDSDLEQRVVKDILMNYLAAISSDMAAAKLWNAPLATTRYHWGLLDWTTRSHVRDEIAFHLDLPILHQISPKDLLKLRRDHHEHFEKFRQSLRNAIRARVQTAENSRSEEIAREIKQDLIEPALADIGARLAQARRSLAKKSGASLVVGSLGTICGLILSNPLAVAAGLAPSVTTALNAFQKYVDDRSNIHLSDMYFLWEVRRHKFMK
jgi:hypothetical protein